VEPVMNTPLLERYGERIAGVLTCYDRLVVTGTLPVVCKAAGMTSFLNTNHIRMFDYPRFAEPLRNRLWENAEALASAAKVKIQFIAKAHIRKEAVVAEVIKARNDHPGLDWSMSSRRWRDARPTGHGTTRRPTRHSCSPRRVSGLWVCAGAV
jgi:hypothetical protein